MSDPSIIKIDSKKIISNSFIFTSANLFGFEKILRFLISGKTFSNNSKENWSFESFLKTLYLKYFLSSFNSLSLDNLEIPDKFFLIDFEIFVSWFKFE